MEAVVTCIALIVLSLGIPQLLDITKHIGFRAGMAIFPVNALTLKETIVLLINFLV